MKGQGVGGRVSGNDPTTPKQYFNQVTDSQSTCNAGLISAAASRESASTFPARGFRAMLTKSWGRLWRAENE